MEFMLIDLVCFDERPLAVRTDDVIIGPDAELEGSPSSDCSGPVLVAFGRCADGSSVCSTFTGYRPWARLVSKTMAHSVQKVKEEIAALLNVPEDLIGVKAEQMPKFYGFHGGASVPTATAEAAKWPAYKVYMPTFRSVGRLEAHFRYPGSSFLRTHFEVTELSTPNTVRAMNELGLEASGWCSLAAFEDTEERISTCSRDIIASVRVLKPRTDITAVAPLKILSFDAEMYSANNEFPAVLHGDFTIAVCASVYAYGLSAPGHAGLQRVAFVCWPAETHGPLPTTTAGLQVVYCANSQDLFERFRDFIVQEDPDLLTGWNIFGFDMPFMWDEYAAARLAPSARGSESLRKGLLAALGRPFKTTAEMLASGRAAHRAVKDSIGKLDMRHRMALRQPENLPEAIGRTLRPAMRAALDLVGPEPDLKPADLPMLRAFAAGATVGPSGPLTAQEGPEARCGALFKTVMDKPMYSGDRALYMGRFCCERSTLTEKRMASAAKGDNTYYFWSGRTPVDLMQIIKDDKKLEDNSLKFAAQTFLDPEYGKIDLSPVEIFKAYREQDPIKMASMVDYCVRDADIPALLIQRLSYVPIWIEMSRVTYTPLQQVLNGGQQRKVYNLIARFVHDEYALNKAESGWPVSDALDDAASDGDVEDALQKRRPDYQGATVIEPKAGFYTDPVSTLDFESLYPSIIIFFNLCPSVYLGPLTGDKRAALERAGYALESHDIQHSILRDVKTDRYEEFVSSYTFVKNVQGVVPRLLQHLLRARKAAKKAMAAAPDEFERAVQNGRQLALKVSCNSVYGFFGVAPGRGLISCKPVAAVTTLKGRAFIDASKTYVEASYPGSSVLYGDTDSIMIKWGRDATAVPVSVPKAYLLAEEASAAITELLRAGAVPGASKPLLATATTAVTLANEKVYTPYLLIQKKNYAAMKYTLKGSCRDTAKATLADFDCDMDLKGIDAVRRDRSKLVKALSEQVLDALLIKQNLALALDSLKATLLTVAHQQAPLELFILSKSLKSTYKNNNQPQVMAWKRMATRGDPDVPEVGTRMPFVIVAGAAGPLYERAEHPDHVRRAKLRYDAKYYIEGAREAIERLLVPTGQGHQVKSLFDTALDISEASGSMSLTRFFKKAKT